MKLVLKALEIVEREEGKYSIYRFSYLLGIIPIKKEAVVRRKSMAEIELYLGGNTLRVLFE